MNPQSCPCSPEINITYFSFAFVLHCFPLQSCSCLFFPCLISLSCFFFPPYGRVVPIQMTPGSLSDILLPSSTPECPQFTQKKVSPFTFCFRFVNSKRFIGNDLSHVWPTQRKWHTHTHSYTHTHTHSQMG